MFYHRTLEEPKCIPHWENLGISPVLAAPTKPPVHGPKLARLSVTHAYAFGRREPTTCSISVLCQLAKECTDAREANYLPTGKKKCWTAPKENARVCTSVSEGACEHTHPHTCASGKGVTQFDWKNCLLLVLRYHFLQQWTGTFSIKISQAECLRLNTRTARMLK